MAFTTKIITDTSPDFGDNPQVIIESGKPEYVAVDNLFPNTDHWVKAELWQDNTLEDTSNVKTFTTLPAGTITLEYIQTTRSGYGYDVTYRYTSTYAPSNAILATNGTQFQGFINGEQHTVSFWVTGLTAGLAYLTNVTLWDIYTESVTVTGSIVTTVVNEVRITDTTPSETSVECELDYVIDGGFTNGYVEYWLATQDPATEQAEGYTNFVDGADSVTMAGLTAGTAYLFRATILLGDGTTEIHSSVVAATTTVNYANQYFTITNESDSNNTISMAGYNNYANPTLLYWSVDNGTTWNSVHLSGTSVNITTLPARKSVLFHHTGHMCGEYTSSGSTSILPFSFRSTENISASGSLHSLAKGRNFVSNKDYSTHQWHGLFQGCTTLVSIRNLKFNNRTVKEYALNSMCSGCINLEDTMDLTTIITIEARGMESMFNRCEKLKENPDIRNAKTVGDNGMYFMCYGCKNLKTSPDVRSVTSVGVNGMHGMLGSCSALETPPDVRNVTTVGTRGMANMLSACSVLKYAYAPNISVWSTTNFTGWLDYVAASGTIYKPSGLIIPTNTTSGVPSGWTTQDY